MSPNSAIVKRIFVVAALLAAVAAEPLAAATIFVDDSAAGANNGTSWADAYTDLQAALAAAVSGDAIWVAAGEYKPTTGTGRTVSFRMVAGVAVCGGFFGNEDPATFNLAGRGLGMNQTILSGDIGVIDDDADNSYHVVVGANDATLDGFTITHGNANGTNSGGGVYCSGSSLVISNCVIRSNSAVYGGGVYGSVVLRNCTVIGNSAQYGGGVYSNNSLAIINCTIVANSASRQGGGVNCYAGSPLITNSIVAFNSSGISGSAGGTPLLRCNCVFGNEAYDYSGIVDPTGTDGNISVDPRFAGLAYGNWHIQPDSPCVDAGDNEAVVGDTDIDGQTRVQPAGGTVDIGADESDGTLWSAGPYAIIRVSPDGDDASDGSSWTLAKQSVQGAINAASAVGGEVWVQAGVYQERIAPRAFVRVFGGFAGTETGQDQRDWVNNVAVLDGQRQGSVVTACVGHRNSRIDGFSIVNGQASYGGGVYCFGGSLIIANCTIRGNSALQCGGGVSCQDALPFIVRCTIRDNIASWEGGGMHCSYSSPTIVNSMIAGNVAAGASSRSGGGGVYCDNYSSPAIGNCTIARNKAVLGGGGIRCSSSTTVTNTIVASNSSGIDGPETGTPVLRHNCVYGNTEFDYAGIPDPTGLDGNIAADPRFAAPAYGNWHIQPDSPCVDAGENAAVADDVDIDNRPRIQPVGGIVDIGADESDGTIWPPGPHAIIRVSPDGNDANDGSSWSLAKQTVQAAIDAASVGGGEVWVGTGTYYECVTLRANAHVYGGFVGTEAERYSRDWTNNRSVLDGQQQGPVVTVSDGFGYRTLDGLRIMHGDASYGGGVYCPAGALAIANCTIAENTASAGGGAYFGGSSSATVVDTMIADNSTTGSSGHGGGVRSSSSSLAITNCTITGNSATGYSTSGGGICCAGSPVIADCRVTGNAARAYGGGIYCAGGAPTITGCTIMANDAYWGGAISCDNSAGLVAHCRLYANTAGLGGGIYGTAHVSDCEIAGNVARTSGGGLYCVSHQLVTNCTIAGNGGGGIHCESSPTIINTIVAFNSWGVFREGSDTPVLRHNCVYGNTDFDYSGLADPTGTDGNISVDPKLASATYGNWHIQPDSPCADAGDNSAVVGDEDSDGQPRIQPVGGTVDIGVDESDGSSWSGEPFVVVRVSPDGDDTNDGSSWPLAKRTVQAGIDAASAAGGEVWVRTGTYYECITLDVFAHVFGGFAGTEITRDERDWVHNGTILDGRQQGAVVTASIGYRNCAIDGLTITGGEAYHGGGINCFYGSPIIANCTIRGNAGSGSNSSIGYGGGLACKEASPLVIGCAIVGNSASSDGGGVYSFAYSVFPVILQCTITGNHASSHGGGVYSRGAATIANCRIAGNAARYGGGASCSYGSTLTNCTIVANRAETGGGIYSSASLPEKMIANTIVAFNSSGIYRSSGSPVLRFNCVYGNGAYDYSGVADPTGTDGNISVDPKLASLAYGDWHIQPDSPCVDSGGNAAVIGEEDMDGQPRVQPAGGVVDIGADESDGTHWPTLPNTIVRVSSDGDDANDGSSWTLAKRTVQAAIDFAAVTGGEVWVQAGTYFERITLHPFAHVFGGFSGEETERSQRDWVNNGTTLDGEARDSVVTILAGERMSTVDGLTITHGDAHYGGGVYCSGGSSPTITNCVVVDNVAWSGGGMCCDSASPTVSHCDIVNNIATVSGLSARGGGVVCLNGSSPMILDCRISDNSTSRYGGAVGCYGSCSPVFRDCAITGNAAAYYGGGFYGDESCSLDIASCLIAGNLATGISSSRGGAVYCSSSCSLAVVDCTIVGNSVSSEGGAICHYGSPVIANTIVAFNSSGIYASSSGGESLAHNCVYGNRAYDYSRVADPTGTNGNISHDPWFVRGPSAGSDGQWGTADDDYGDLHLDKRSLCIDAGDNAAVPAGIVTDLDGRPRIVDGDRDYVAVVDMGSYEYAPILSDIDDDGDVDMEDFDAFRVCFNGPNRAPVYAGCDTSDLDGDGDVDLTDFSRFASCYNGYNRPPACW